MAKAFKCDICGNYYAAYNDDSRSDFSNGIRFTQKAKADAVFPIIKYDDLCPECLIKIALFIEDLKCKDGTVDHEKFKKRFCMKATDETTKAAIKVIIEKEKEKELKRLAEEYMKGEKDESADN